MKWIVGILVVLVLAVGGGAFWLKNSETGTGMAIGVNFAAKALCSCMLVEGREEEACRADMIVQSGASIPATIDRETGEVRTSIFGLFTGHASYEEGRGCTIH